MAFWSLWRGKKRGAAELPERSPAADAASRAASVPAPSAPDDESADTAPMSPQDASAGPIAAAAPAGWPDRAEIAALGDHPSETDLARIIGRAAHDASADEILFRAHLSRAIYVGEHELAPLPRSAARVMELARKPGAGVDEYAKVVEGDPGLVKTVLRLANSSFYASLAECTSLSQAMVRIGVREVERIALLQTYQTRVFRVPGHDALARELSRHGLAAALAAQAVARRGQASPPDAFLGGLFHDVGKLVILGIVGQVQRRLKRTAPAPLIHSAFDAFHAVVGEAVCRRWEFPPPIVAAIARHHDPQAACREPLDRAVYLGNLLAHGVDNVPTAPLPIGNDDPVRAAAGLSPGQLLEALEQTRAELKEYQKLFG